MESYFISIIIVIIATLLGSYAGILIKKGTNKSKIKISNILKNKYIISGIIIYGISSIIFLPMFGLTLFSLSFSLCSPFPSLGILKLHYPAIWQAVRIPKQVLPVSLVSFLWPYHWPSFHSPVRAPSLVLCWLEH